MKKQSLLTNSNTPSLPTVYTPKLKLFNPFEKKTKFKIPPELIDVNKTILRLDFDCTLRAAFSPDSKYLNVSFIPFLPIKSSQSTSKIDFFIITGRTGFHFYDYIKKTFKQDTDLSWSIEKLIEMTQKYSLNSAIDILQKEYGFNIALITLFNARNSIHHYFVRIFEKFYFEYLKSIYNIKKILGPMWYRFGAEKKHPEINDRTYNSLEEAIFSVIDGEVIPDEKWLLNTKQIIKGQVWPNPEPEKISTKVFLNACEIQKNKLEELCHNIYIRLHSHSFKRENYMEMHKIEQKFYAKTKIYKSTAVESTKVILIALSMEWDKSIEKNKFLMVDDYDVVIEGIKKCQLRLQSKKSHYIHQLIPFKYVIDNGCRNIGTMIEHFPFGLRNKTFEENITEFLTSHITELSQWKFEALYRISLFLLLYLNNPIKTELSGIIHDDLLSLEISNQESLFLMKILWFQNKYKDQIKSLASGHQSLLKREIDKAEKLLQQPNLKFKNINFSYIMVDKDFSFKENKPEPSTTNSLSSDVNENPTAGIKIS